MLPYFANVCILFFSKYKEYKSVISKKIIILSSQ